MRTSDEIREAYLRFFEGKAHLRMPSASLIPAGDPTLLLTSAGMVPFKEYFMGQASPPSRRMTSSQKSFRTTDIDAVGDDTHCTFFEMLGNFSVGDYFKKEAIAFAWEFSTQVLQLPPERLWITIYLDDDEAFDHWHRDIGVPEERIIRFGEEDNYWGPAGNEGPCGPCSELHYDFHPERGMNGETPNDDSGRFVEFWNLVFMQFYQHLDGTRVPLPAPNIDTGMGLDRTAVILQGARNVYETDLFQPIVARVSELAGVDYGAGEATDTAIRVVAEHSRGAAFLIGDGVVPGNDGRGYVLRRLIRRAVRFGRVLGLTEPFLVRVAESVIDRMAHVYPDLATGREFILRVLALEEDRFQQVFDNGARTLAGMVGYREFHRGALPEVIRFARGHSPSAENASRVLEQYGFVGYHPDANEYERQGHMAAAELISEATYVAFMAMEHENIDVVDLAFSEMESWGTTLSGQEAFFLHDTYGFPVEITQEIAGEHGLSVDMDGFRREMEAQRERSRAGGDRFGGGPQARIFQYQDLGVAATRFLGYDRLAATSVVVGMLSPDGESVATADAGQEVEIVLRETPFYAEGGGQVGDAGAITAPGGRVEVTDTHAPIQDLVVHRARVAEGVVAVGDQVEAVVDADRRLDAARNHTGTHLLHAALRKVLGSHVRQAGSLVAPDRLRFDFTHVQAPSSDELAEVERMVNRETRDDSPVQVRESTYTAAVSEGALAFFGDKYGEHVRVVQMGCDGSDDGPACFSVEVCGGTHLARTGEVGLFLITAEGSIGSGLRRIEAVTGRAAEAAARHDRERLESLARRLDTAPADLETRVADLMDELDQERRRAAGLERDLARREAEGLLAHAVEVNGAQVLAARVTAASAESMRDVGDYLKAKMGSGLVVLGAVLGERPVLVAMATPDLVDRGVDAAAIAKQAAAVMGGGGGGSAATAQAGGRSPEKLDDALALVPTLLRD